MAIEKNLDVQSAVQFVFTMIQSAVNRYLEVKASVPKFDPETDELVSKYARGIECCTRCASNDTMKFLYDRTDRADSGLVYWHFEIDRYFGPKVSELVYSFPIKVLPQEKNALDPGVQLKYSTFSTVAASVGNEESKSKDAPLTSTPGLLSRWYRRLYG